MQSGGVRRHTSDCNCTRKTSAATDAISSSFAVHPVRLLCCARGVALTLWEKGAWNRQPRQNGALVCADDLIIPPLTAQLSATTITRDPLGRTVPYDAATPSRAVLPTALVHQTIRSAEGAATVRHTGRELTAENARHAGGAKPIRQVLRNARRTHGKRKQQRSSERFGTERTDRTRGHSE